MKEYGNRGAKSLRKVLMEIREELNINKLF